MRILGGIMNLKWIFILVLLGAISQANASSKITSIDFNGVVEPNEVIIRSDTPPLYEKQESPQDKQIILEFKETTISKSNTRPIDTSAFKSKVSQISPYVVEGKTDTVRVVIQLREFVSAEVVAD